MVVTCLYRGTRAGGAVERLVDVHGRRLGVRCGHGCAGRLWNGLAALPRQCHLAVRRNALLRSAEERRGFVASRSARHLTRIALDGLSSRCGNALIRPSGRENAARLPAPRGGAAQWLGAHGANAGGTPTADGRGAAADSAAPCGAGISAIASLAPGPRTQCIGAAPTAERRVTSHANTGCERGVARGA